MYARGPPQIQLIGHCSYCGQPPARGRPDENLSSIISNYQLERHGALPLPPHNPPPWMLLVDPHLQGGVGDLRVHLRCRDAAVAEEALDVADVYAFLQKV